MSAIDHLPGAGKISLLRTFVAVSQPSMANRRTNCAHGISGALMPSHRKPPVRRRVRKQSRNFDPQAFLASAGIGRTVLCLQPKQAVFSQGERADTVFYIQAGAVRLSVLSQHGKEATLSLLGPGDFLGEGCLASDQPIRLASGYCYHQTLPS